MRARADTEDPSPGVVERLSEEEPVDRYSSGGDVHGYKVVVECTVKAPFALSGPDMVIFEEDPTVADEGVQRYFMREPHITTEGFSFRAHVSSGKASISIPGQGSREFEWQDGICDAVWERPAALVEGFVMDPVAGERQWVVGCGVDAIVQEDGSFTLEILETDPCFIRVRTSGLDGPRILVTPLPGETIEATLATH